MIGRRALAIKFYKFVSIAGLLLLCFSVLCCGRAQGQSGRQVLIAPVPPMGWASWNHFFCDYNENTIRQQADALVSTGMRDAGYKYVVIQECISRERDATGSLIADAVRFPHGISALVEYIHKLGLKAGIYTDIGEHTCYPNPRYQGSYGHEEQDALTFARWKIDFVEMDYCNREAAHTGKFVYEKMAAAIKATGREMVFYLCCWGNEQPWEWAQGKAQMWRTEFDISLEKNHVEWRRLVGNFESNTVHSVFSAPDSWNDADMLEIGNPGLSDSEAQAQFSMWVMSPSPLLAGADLNHMRKRIRDIYTNKRAIAIDQDPLGAGAEIVSEGRPGVDVWKRALGSRTGDDVAVMLLNASDKAASMRVEWNDIGLQKNARVFDVWNNRESQAVDGVAQEVPQHSAVLLVVHGRRSWERASRFEAETPSNLRSGNTKLLSCGECSSGYSVQLGGDDSGGALKFTRIHAETAGLYQLKIAYVRNGLEDTDLALTVNDGAATTVKAIMRSWNTITVPVFLKAGDNTVSIGHAGRLPFDLDDIELFR